MFMSRVFTMRQECLVNTDKGSKINYNYIAIFGINVLFCSSSTYLTKSSGFDKLRLDTCQEEL